MENNENEIRDVLKSIANIDISGDRSSLKKEFLKINEDFNSLKNFHFTSGYVCKNINKFQSLMYSDHLEEKELEKIYYLSESLAPALRLKCLIRYGKTLIRDEDEEEKRLPLNKENLEFKCAGYTEIGFNIKQMLNRVQELPKEWTIIQITSKWNVTDRMQLDNIFSTNPIDLVIFDCGQTNSKPFSIHLNVPEDKVTRAPIEICQEMFQLIKDIKDLTKNFTQISQMDKYNLLKKKSYTKMRADLDFRLQDILTILQNKWLGPWRCFFIGKYKSSRNEQKVVKVVEDLLKNFDVNVTDTTKTILKYILKGTSHLRSEEICLAIKYLFPSKNKTFYTQMMTQIKKLSEKNCLEAMSKEVRYPVILVIDELLDFFPWEMLDVIVNHSVCRMPSLRFTYALFKEHEKNIKDGFITNIHPANGTYVINPGLDLKKMETRLVNYFNYWTPNWQNGIVGRKPMTEEIENLLIEKDIFIYAGHGDGSQFIPGENIERLRVNGVVFLFGCSSAKLKFTSPIVEMEANFHKYLMACCPCVIGALYVINDLDTDIFATNFLSLWIPSTAKYHWNTVDKKKWAQGKPVVIEEKSNSKISEKQEPELLLAFSSSRKTCTDYMNKAAFVARGLPVKLSSR